LRGCQPGGYRSKERPVSPQPFPLYQKRDYSMTTLEKYSAALLLFSHIPCAFFASFFITLLSGSTFTTAPNQGAMVVRLLGFLTYIFL
jgi:hypothetical protein